MLADFNKNLETFLNNDEELQRRLAGFKHFAGVPDRHYRRARANGVRSIDRAVKCYPFGGESLLGNGDIISITITDGSGESSVIISLKDTSFTVKGAEGKKPHLKLEMPKETFKLGILGRHRWIMLFGRDEVKISYSKDLPHSDWVTILEILVAMQELAEFHPEMWQLVESL